MSGNKRILKELAEIQNNPPPGCSVKLAKDEDFLIWNVVMDGPPGSVYADGKYQIQITLPKEYPFKPPVLNFRTRIYHPNIMNDEKGAMCLGMLKAEEWKPPNRIVDVLALVRLVLAEPQPDDAVETSIADQYKRDRKAFEKTARDCVGRYAK